MDRAELATVLTFKRTRAAAKKFLTSPHAWAVVWLVAAASAYVLFGILRARADDVGFSVRSSGLEEALFGGMPSVWLQRLVPESAAMLADWAVAIVHASWFLVPWVAALFVAVRRPLRSGSLAFWWVLTLAIALPVFVVFPMEPPWMADANVSRLNAVHLGSYLEDPNVVAAMPSLHVALPLALGLWFARERWTRPAQVMFAYSAITAVEVVFAGEHYVVDVVGAGVVALVVAKLASLDYAAAFRSLSARLQRARAPMARPRPVSQASPFKSQRAQALIEFAFIAPLLFVFLFAIVDFGIAVDRRITLQHSVREGARFAAVHSVEIDIQQKTVDQSQGIIDVADVGVCYLDGVDGNTTVGDPGDSVRVSVLPGGYTWEFPIMTEILGAFGVPALTIEMTPHGTARLERGVTGAVACPP